MAIFVDNGWQPGDTMHHLMCIDQDVQCMHMWTGKISLVKSAVFTGLFWVTGCRLMNFCLIGWAVLICPEFLKLIPSFGLLKKLKHQITVMEVFVLFLFFLKEFLFLSTKCVLVLELAHAEEVKMGQLIDVLGTLLFIIPVSVWALLCGCNFGFVSCQNYRKFSCQWNIYFISFFQQSSHFPGRQ